MNPQVKLIKGIKGLQKFLEELTKKHKPLIDVKLAIENGKEFFLVLYRD